MRPGGRDHDGQTAFLPGLVGAVRAVGAVREYATVPISLITGPANSGKAERAMQALRAHCARGLEPLLVVPTDLDQARYRRELAENGVVMGVRVERFAGLLGEVLRRAGRSEPTLGELARESALASIATRRHCMQYGAGPGLARALAALIAELQAARVTPVRLRTAFEQAGLDSAQRLCALFEDYHAMLSQAGFTDRELRLTRALDRLRNRPALWGATPVVLYGFDSFTELQLDAIETLGSVVDAPVHISLSYEPGRAAFVDRAGAFHRLRPLAREHIVLEPRAEYYHPDSRTPLHHLERWLFEPDAPRIETHGAVRLLEGATPRAELQLVAQQIRTLLDEGVAAEEIAIVHRSPQAVAGLLAETLEDLSIPHRVRAGARFAHTGLGRGLLGLTRCALGVGQLGDLIAWLRAPGVLDRPELADRLEATALRRGIDDAERARDLWEAERWPLERIDRLRAAVQAGPPALLDALAAELARLFCAPRKRAAAVLDGAERQEADALVCAIRALEQLRELARGAPHLFPTESELVELLARLDLDESEGSAAGAVVLCDPLSLRARRVCALFLCGLQEGVFPAPTRAHPLLGERERRLLAQHAGLLLPGAQHDQLAAERYLLYALCSRPERLLALSWHVTDENGAPCASSLFLDDVCDVFAEDLRQRIARQPPPQNGEGGEAGPAIAPLRDVAVLADLRERTLWSASSLEAWTACPVRWFVERLLRLDGLDTDPEPLARGAIAHAALRDTFYGLRERTGSARITPASVGQAKHLLHDALREHAARRPLSSAAERVPGALRRLDAELERYLEHAAQAPSPLEPTHLELEFGFDAEHDRPSNGTKASQAAQTAGLPALELREGVRLRGRIDRIDVGSDGRALIYDYKGRSAPPGARWANDGAIQVAVYMHAAQRLLGLEPVGGFYQPLAGKDLRARGVLDSDSGLELDCVRTDRRSHEEIEEILERCRAAALAAIDEIRDGRLQARPESCSYNGGGCAYPEICRCER